MGLGVDLVVLVVVVGLVVGVVVLVGKMVGVSVAGMPMGGGAGPIDMVGSIGTADKACRNKVD